MEDEDTDPGTNQDRSWSRRERAGWWVKYAAVVGPTVALLTLLSTCGVLQWGVQTTEDAAKQHRTLALEMETKLEASMGRIEAALGRLEARIDAVVVNSSSTGDKRRPRR